MAFLPVCPIQITKATSPSSLLVWNNGLKVDVSVDKSGLEVVNSHDLFNVIIGRQLPLWVVWVRFD